MNGLNYIIGSGILTSNTGALKLFYDFTDSGNYLDGESVIVKWIPSFDGGANGHSGEIKLFGREMVSESPDFFADTDFSETIKSDHLNLLGNRINVDYEQSSYLEVLNSNGMYSGNGFTFIVEGGKLTRDEAQSIYYSNELAEFEGFNEQKPFHNKEIIFSNVVGTGIDYSGWEFGLNGANLFYFRTSDADGQKVLTYDKNIPFGQNIWAVRHYDKRIDVLRYNPVEEETYSNSMFLGRTLRNGGTWRLNSGENSDLLSLDTGKSSGATSSITLKKFLYLNEALSDNQIRTACEYLNKNVSSDYPYIIDSGYIYSITGTEEICVERSGLLYTESVLSGYVDYSGIVTGDPVFTPFSGWVCPSGDYLTEVVTGTYYTTILTGYEPLYALTGFDYYLPESGWLERTEIYINSGVSGVVYSNCSTGYLEGEVYYEVTGYTTGISGAEEYENLRPRSFSYIGQRNEYDIMDIRIANDVYSGTQKIANNQAKKAIGRYRDGFTLFTELLSTGITGEINFYLNGVAVRIGAGEPTTVEIDGQEYNSFGIEKDCYLTENQEMLSDILFTGFNQISNLHGIYDIVAGEREELVVSDVSAYSTIPFEEIHPENKDIFLNGVKLMDGVDYDMDGEYFSPREELFGITGIYFAFPRVVGQTYYTGESVYDIYGTGFFEKDSVSVWINGIRRNSRECFYHDSFVDMISGTDIGIDFGSGAFEGRIEV